MVKGVYRVQVMQQRVQVQGRERQNHAQRWGGGGGEGWIGCDWARQQEVPTAVAGLSIRLIVGRERERVRATQSGAARAGGQCRR